MVIRITLTVVINIVKDEFWYPGVNNISIDIRGELRFRSLAITSSLRYTLEFVANRIWCCVFGR